MSLASKLRDLKNDLKKIETQPVSESELLAINAFLSDLDGVLESAQGALVQLGGRLAAHDLAFDGSDPRVLDIRKCIGVLATARGQLRDELVRVLTERGVLPS